MNEEIKQKWVAALRSGKYSQTRETLQDENGFCCLGVLCEVMKLPKPIPYIYTFRGKHLEKDLTHDFRDSVGLSYTAEGELIELNDKEHYSFAEIAEYIEENL
jgi:hypothetical protein